jgi:hypothetical protein
MVGALLCRYMDSCALSIPLVSVPLVLCIDPVPSTSSFESRCLPCFTDSNKLSAPPKKNSKKLRIGEVVVQGYAMLLCCGVSENNRQVILCVMHDAASKADRLSRCLFTVGLIFGSPCALSLNTAAVLTERINIKLHAQISH